MISIQIGALGLIRLSPSEDSNFIAPNTSGCLLFNIYYWGRRPPVRVPANYSESNFRYSEIIFRYSESNIRHQSLFVSSWPILSLRRYGAFVG